MKLVQYNEYLISIVDTDGLMLSTRASVAKVVTTHPCITRCLGVKQDSQAVLYLNGEFELPVPGWPKSRNHTNQKNIFVFI